MHSFFPPVLFPHNTPPILACGGDVKNIFSLADNTKIFPGPDLGDLQDAEVYYSFKKSIAHYSEKLGIKPEIVAIDKHPGYLSSRYGRELGLPVVEVQHHHAHIASVMAEHRLEGNIIGLALDGTGYGDDGTIWGGEIFLANFSNFFRVGHFKPILLPGGDAAVKEPWRTATALLFGLFGGNMFDVHPEFVEKIGLSRIQHIVNMIKAEINCPLSSSAGRLFDAAASILGVRHENTFEAQAPMKLESIADPKEKRSFAYNINNDGVIDFAPMMKQLVGWARQKNNVDSASAMFHNTIAIALAEICRSMQKETGKVVLSGGVFQNRFLLKRLVPLLERDNFEVFLPEQIPINDGGLCIGQTAIAIRDHLL